MGNRLRLLVIALLTCWSMPCDGAGAEQQPETDYSKVTLDFDNFNPASRCGECHIDIYALWSKSIHARALVDPVFLATFMEDRIQNDDRFKKRCLQCHAPTLHYNPELSLNSGIAVEGVTCDFCHSIQDLDLQNTVKPFVVKWGKLKRGPLKDTQSPVHETKHSKIFESGDLCGGCHEMANMNNLPIITTYSEWKNSYYQKVDTATCQSCHMPLAAGMTVSQKHQKTKRRINLHSFPGGHSRAQLLDALEMKILDETKSYGKMTIRLGLTNVGAGHYIPTGNPLRKVVVDFYAYDATNRQIHNEQVELSKKFADKDGKALSTDLGILLDATSVTEDNRIPPGGTKVLAFQFMAPNEKILVEARVIYVYRNEAHPEMARQEKLITFTKIVNKERTERVVEGAKVQEEEASEKSKK